MDEPLAKVKKGDALALVTGNGLLEPPTTVQVIAKRRWPQSIDFEHEGCEYRVRIDGRGPGFRQHVEVWDAARAAERVRVCALHDAKRRIFALNALQHTGLIEEDVLREPERFAALEGLRERFLREFEVLLSEIKSSRS